MDVYIPTADNDRRVFRLCQLFYYCEKIDSLDLLVVKLLTTSLAYIWFRTPN